MPYSRCLCVCAHPQHLTRGTPHIQEVHGAVPAHERHALQLEAGAATRVYTNVQFKRNVAKGPNPLSVKRKRKPGGDDAPRAQAAGGDGEGEVRVCCEARVCVCAAVCVA